MRFIFFADVHISDTAPSLRTETYTEDILDKLEEIASLCATAKTDYAIFGGDFFNSKIAARVSHNLVNKSLTVLDKFPCPIIFIVGSHDVPYGRLDLLYKRPIGTILRHPKVMYISDVLELCESKSLSIRIFPVSDSYNNTTEEVLTALRMQREGFKGTPTLKYYDIALLHQPVVREGTYPYPVVQAVDLVGEADLCLYGHMHNYEGVWTTVVADKSTTFVNLGAVSRGSIDEKSLSREPKVFLFEVSEEGTLSLQKEVCLKSARPVAEVFRLAEKQEQLDRAVDIEVLLTSMKETQFVVFSTQSAIERIKSLTYSGRADLLPEEHDFSAAHFEAVKTVAVELLEELEA